MVEPINELKKRCQKQNYTLPWYKFESAWRTLTIRVTWFLLHTNVTANQVTMFMIFLGFLSASFFALGNYWSAITGAVILQLVYLLDGVDGEIARYRKAQSAEGVFLDLITHLANISIPFIGITIGLYRLNSSIEVVVLGLFASVFSVFVLDIQALKHQVIFMKLIEKSRQSEKIENLKNFEGKETQEKRGLKNIFKIYINPFFENYLITNIIFVTSIFSKLYWMLIFYGLTFPVIWLIKLVYEYKLGYSRYGYLKSYKKP